jgi:glutaredoxin
MEIPKMPSARFLAAAVLAGLAVASVAQAQPIYRIIGPDGKVTFSDRPPPDAAGGKPTIAPTVALPGGGADTTASLPFELRSASGRYPVTLYSRPGCGPCDAGRNYLSNRGIPFAEKTITSQEDIEALQRLSGTPTLPFVTIGGQQLKGFSEVEWGQFLDAAGYPKTSQLPASYRRPGPTPLVIAARPAQQAQSEGDSGTTSAPQPSLTSPTGPSPENPAGIRF